MADKTCPNCGGEMGPGMVLYECCVCGEDCCSECSDNFGPTGNDVICEACLEDEEDACLEGDENE